MQNPNTPTAHRANTAARSAHTGHRENVETKCETIPKHGSIATYTSACAKNQNQRCQIAISERARRAHAAQRTAYRAAQSENSSTHAASKIPKINKLSIAVTYQAHTVSGSRVESSCPSVRTSVTVVQKLIEVRIAPNEKHATLNNHSTIPLDRQKE